METIELVDSHCHLDDERLATDLDQVLARAHQAGIVKVVVPGVSARHWPRLQTLTQRAPGLYAAYGLHPMFLEQHRKEHLEMLRHWLEQERPVAVGECGLDYYLPHLDVATQTEFFVAQLRLAREFDLPVVLHARRAVDDVIKHLRRFPGLRGEVHSFSGSEQQAHQLLDMGFLLGIGGPVTYPRAQRLRRLVAGLPITGLLLETDAPDQPAVAHRGRLNEPAFLPEVLYAVASLREETPTSVAAALNRNACTLFKIT